MSPGVMYRGAPSPWLPRGCQGETALGVCCNRLQRARGCHLAPPLPDGTPIELMECLLNQLAGLTAAIVIVPPQTRGKDRGQGEQEPDERRSDYPLTALPRGWLAAGGGRSSNEPHPARTLPEQTRLPGHTARKWA